MFIKHNRQSTLSVFSQLGGLYSPVQRQLPPPNPKHYNIIHLVVNSHINYEHQVQIVLLVIYQVQLASAYMRFRYPESQSV